MTGKGVGDMGDLIVCGGGVIGLATATMLARDGHRVTVLEADADGFPDASSAAWESWQRRGVAQFRQPHTLFARFRQVCDAELPEVTDLLLAAGCARVDYVASRPPALAADAPREGDAELRFVTGRRPVVEAVFAGLAAREPGLTVRRGVRVAGLLTGPSAVAGVPHVAGVLTTDGEALPADLVVDAMGRRTPSTEWITGLGARAPQVETEDSGFTYYTRFFRGPVLPQLRGRPIMPIGSISVLTLPGDNDTWSVTLYSGSGDTPLKAFRHSEVFDRVVAACPLQAHWLDGTAITDVLPMAGAMDRHRQFMVDGVPVATGIVPVGDAWACTNPSAGRGISVGAAHAQLLREVVRKHLDQPAELASVFHERTEQVVGPFYRNQVAADRFRMTEMAAARNGTTPPLPDPRMAAFVAAAATDSDAFRGLLEMAMCAAFPEEVMARPAVRAAMAAWDGKPAPPVPGPDRSELLRLLAA
jgi:2-polyprenyl-6-methoxyphenol hydroxylase-like FAD-dependent oxidoreductase